MRPGTCRGQAEPGEELRLLRSHKLRDNSVQLSTQFRTLRTYYDNKEQALVSEYCENFSKYR